MSPCFIYYFPPISLSKPHSPPSREAAHGLISKAREEVDADLRAVSFTLDPKERKMIQKETLSAIFETYFRILKHSMSASNSRYKANNVSPAYGSFSIMEVFADKLLSRFWLRKWGFLVDILHLWIHLIC